MLARDIKMFGLLCHHCFSLVFLYFVRTKHRECTLATSPIFIIGYLEQTFPMEVQLNLKHVSFYQGMQKKKKNLNYPSISAIFKNINNQNLLMNQTK